MSTSFTLSAYQWRGVWGERQTGTLQVGKGYCANLGHVEDDTGLVYMRARYYEPTTGRFITEDPARDGMNWYVYCSDNPVNKTDPSGEEEQDDSFDPVYESLSVLHFIENAAFFLAGMPLNSYRGMAAKGVLRTMLALGAKYQWVQNFLKSKFWGRVRGLTRITSKGLTKSYYAWLAIGGTFAIAAATYIELLINARHAAWWDFCFGEEAS